MALPDWTSQHRAADRLFLDRGFEYVFCTQTLVAEEMRSVRGRKVKSGEEMKNSSPPTFPTMVQETKCLLGEVVENFPTSIQKEGSQKWRTAKEKGVLACTECGIGTSWAFVMCSDVPKGGPHCLRHYNEARQGGVGVLTIHLPQE